jgi:nucleoid-associated protein YgaU
VPLKPEDSSRVETAKTAEASAGAARIPEPATSPVQPAPAAGGPRTYVVQPGDTLSGISLKLYNTSRHWEKLYEANRDKISDPGVMVVGTKLTVPDLPVKAGPATGGGAVPTAAAPAGARVHQVQPNDSLWKIAERYAGDRGVLEMIEAILKANPDKLKDEKSLLKVGWSLVIPE